MNDASQPLRDRASGRFMKRIDTVAEQAPAPAQSALKPVYRPCAADARPAIVQPWPPLTPWEAWLKAWGDLFLIWFGAR